MFLWQRIHFIDELARHGVIIETFNPLIYESYEEANERLLNMIKNGRYDMFMTCLCEDNMIFISTIEEIKRLGIPTLSFRPDNLVVPFYDKKVAPHFDLLWLTARETKHLYDKWGVKSFFAPYAANPYTFQFYPSDILNRVCFIGTPYGSRSIMINTLSSNTIEVDAYCIPNQTKDGNLEAPILKIDLLSPSILERIISDLRFKEGRKVLLGSIVNKLKGATLLKDNDYLHKKNFVAPSEISSIYSKYSLCLSSTSTNHTDALKNPLKIVNLRAFEVPMSGGLNICKFNPELANYFEEGKEIIFYHDNEELIDKASYYTKRASSNELLSMKKAARYRAESEHSWWNRFTIAFDILGLKY